MALKQALTPEFRAYQRQVVANCRALAQTLMELGYKIVTGINEDGRHRDLRCGPLLRVARSLTPRFIQSGRGCRLVALAWWL